MKITALILMLCLCGCAAAPWITTAAGYVTSGGATLYKSEKSYGPKAELVLVKIEPTVYQCPCPKGK